jgi:hypothetical protein
MQLNNLTKKIHTYGRTDGQWEIDIPFHIRDRGITKW